MRNACAVVCVPCWQGWWAGSAEGDPTGHVLHIGPEFGRWTGRVYTAGDVAELFGLREASSPLARLRTRSMISREKEAVHKVCGRADGQGWAGYGRGGNVFCTPPCHTCMWCLMLRATRVCT